LAAFQARRNAVLVATQSFWEGVDIPGHALRLVVLEKLPFLVPSDPLVKARSLAIERAGGSAFMDLFIPEAAISLKQGFGRLVRSESDSGVVALLDERVHRHGYARKLLSALPPAARTNEFADVQRFADQVLAKSALG
jgi:ATP-dependent DNA helicase DinG